MVNKIIDKHILINRLCAALIQQFGYSNVGNCAEISVCNAARSEVS